MHEKFSIGTGGIPKTPLGKTPIGPLRPTEPSGTPFKLSSSTAFASGTTGVVEAVVEKPSQDRLGEAPSLWKPAQVKQAPCFALWSVVPLLL